MAESGQCSAEESFNEAEEQFSDVLSGLKEIDNHLFTAENADGVAVGTIWYTTENPKQVFILDFAVHEEYRRMGYGQAILDELERQLKLDCVPLIVLHVFEHNASAVKLYEKCGFVRMKSDGADEGSLYMGKEI